MTRSGDLSSAPKAQTWRSGKLRRLSALAIAVVALCLAWEVVSSGVAAYLARSSPHTQPLFGRRGPTAVFNAADTALIQEAVALERARRSAATPPNDDNAAAKAPAPPALLDRDELRREVEAQLTSDPLSAQGLRILGQLQPDDAAAPFMAAAANRSLREVIAVFWLEERERRLGRYDEALKYADMLLRARPGLTTQLAPVLTRMLEDPDTTKSMYRLVATNPPWADIFLQLVTTSIIDIRAPLGLFVHLKDANVPVREAIKQSYVDFLIRNRDYDFAYSAWQQLMPADHLSRIRLLFDGKFELPRSGYPFDWNILSGNNVTIEFERLPDDGANVLRLEYGRGRSSPHTVYQYLALPPGPYRFSGHMKGELTGRRGHRWRVVCIPDSNTTLGQSEMILGSMRDWKEFHFDIDIPDRPCPLQQLQLFFDSRSASEELLAGKINYGDLNLVRRDELDKH